MIDTDSDNMYFVDIGEDTICNDLDEYTPNKHCVVRKDQTPPLPYVPRRNSQNKYNQ